MLNQPHKSNLTRDVTNPIAIGDLVVVISMRAKTAFIEGLAVIKDTCEGLHRFKVRFIGDTRLHERVVHRIYQRAPEEAVSWLNALMREPSEELPDDFLASDTGSEDEQ